MERFVIAALNAGKSNDCLDAGDIEGGEEVMTLAIGIGLAIIVVLIGAVIVWDIFFETRQIRRLKPMVIQIIESSQQPVRTLDILEQLEAMDPTDDSIGRLYVVLDLLDAEGVTGSTYGVLQRWVSMKETA